MEDKVLDSTAITVSEADVPEIIGSQFSVMQEYKENLDIAKRKAIEAFLFFILIQFHIGKRRGKPLLLICSPPGRIIYLPQAFLLPCRLCR